MILRLSAGVALLLGLALLLAFLEVVGEGPFASPAGRHLRAMKERTALPRSAPMVDAAWMHALPHGRPPAATAPIERGAVTIEGWVQRIMWASDGDIHLEVTPEPPPADGETHYLTAEITSAFRRHHPGWRYGPLAAALRPIHGSGMPWPGGPRRVRVSGWLLYDFQYDLPDSAWRPGGGAARMTGWEVHPVTRLQLLDEATGRWDEVGP